VYVGPLSQLLIVNFIDYLQEQVKFKRSGKQIVLRDINSHQLNIWGFFVAL